MDGRGRWIDTVLIGTQSRRRRERLWRSVNDECVYLHAFNKGADLRAGLSRWMAYYNTRRPHSALSRQTPDEAYHQIAPSPCPGHGPDRVMGTALAA
jgi:putative transposase